MKKIKVITINIGLFLLMAILIETGAYVLPVFFGKGINTAPAWFYYNGPGGPCTLFRTHPILNHVHDHNNKCNIRGGYMRGSYVYYDKNYNNKKVIITLGGSTTDGALQQSFANGYSWPFILDKRLESSGVNVINGGVGAYGSSQELLKLLTSVRNLPYNITNIVSLNGINDIKGYNSTTDFIRNNIPFFTGQMAKMYNNQKWLIKNKRYMIPLFPSTQYILIQILKKIQYGGYETKGDYVDGRAQKSISPKSTKKLTPVGRWKYNIEMMYHISKVLGAEYDVFLQPTMGLKGRQSKAPSGTSDAKLLKEVMSKQWVNGKPYVKVLNSFYSKAEKICNTLKYCHNISNRVYPTGNVYRGPRHHNAKGNRKIAKLIYRELSLKFK